MVLLDRVHKGDGLGIAGAYGIEVLGHDSMGPLHRCLVKEQCVDVGRLQRTRRAVGQLGLDLWKVYGRGV